MNPWFPCNGVMPSNVQPEDEIIVKFRNGNQYRRKAAECDWSQDPPSPGDIVECRHVVDPIEMVKALSATSFAPMEARNVYIVGPLALYVHDATEAELRKAMADIQRYFEVFIKCR